MVQVIAGVSPAAEDVIRRAVAETLVGIPVDECKISTGLDYMDEETIFVEVRLGLVAQPFDSELDTKLSVKIHQRLYDIGEHRMPDLNIEFADGQKIMGW